MSHIVVACITAHGHLRPTLPVAAELVARGHRVTYVVGDEHADLVTATGAAHLPFTSTVTRTPPPATIDADSVADVPLTYLAENEAALAGCLPALDGDRPDLVVYDTTMFAAGRVLGRRFGVPLVRTSPTFAAHEGFSVDALAAGRLGVDPANPKFVEFYRKLLVLLGRHGMGEADAPAMLAPAERRTVVFLPRSMQLSAETFDDRFAFVGLTAPTAQAAPATPTASTPDPTDGSPAFTPPPGDGPLVLVSLGSAFNDRPEFYAAVVRAFAGEPERVLLVLGRPGAAAALEAEVGATAPNVTAHDWLSYADVLPHIDACITNGGIGTSLAALWHGAPLLVVPQMPENEFAAERLVELGVARALAPAEVTPEALRDGLRRLLPDPVVARRVRELHDEMAAAGGTARAADLVEERLRSA